MVIIAQFSHGLLLLSLHQTKVDQTFDFLECANSTRNARVWLNYAYLDNFVADSGQIPFEQCSGDHPPKMMQPEDNLFSFQSRF